MDATTINDAQTIAGNGEGTLLAGRYRVVRQLGQGGMGSVWLAEDVQLDNKPFAIKMLPAILVANKRAYRQLKDEALVAMRLVHPNIVQIRAFEENNGNPFLVMDYIDGQTLDDYLAEHAGTTGVSPTGTGLPESDVLRILRPIAAALDYAHDEGVVHRDVKPANVMIRKDGHPFILDFGIAREIQETLTRVTGKLSSGTLLYMSPEQLMGEHPKKEQDIYSFAAMAYECLKGEPPFVRGQIEHQILNAPPLPLRGGPRSCVTAVMAGLAKKPADRPRSCAAVLEGRVTLRGGGAPTGSQEGNGVWKVLVAAIMLGAAISGGWLWMNERAAEPKAAPPVEKPLAPAAGDAGNPSSPNGAVAAPSDTNRMVAAGKAEDAFEPRGDAPETNKPPEKILSKTLVTKLPKASSPVQEPKIDKAFIKLTNDLALALGTRKAAYDSAEEFRGSPRGFAARLKEIDDMWNGRTIVEGVVSRQTAEKSLAAVKHEIDALQTAVKWLADNRKARDAAVERETKVDDFLAEGQQADAVLFARARSNPKWRGVQDTIESARKSIDKGAFDGAVTAFDNAEGNMRGILEDEKSRQKEENRLAAEQKKKAEDEQKAKREAAAREAARRQFLARLNREGFILDEAANRYPPGTEKRIVLSKGESMAMVWCPPGCFMMGSPETEMERIAGETRHAVRLTKGFWIGKYEVTKGQWAAIMGESVWFGGNQPKSSVSWDACREFIGRLKGVTGLAARLPTEAEWEYACRAGTSSPFSFGSVLNGAQACCNGGEPYGVVTRGPANMSGPSDVGSFSRYANAWGINDMHGNLFEWCQDAFSDYPSVAEMLEDPVNEKQGAVRVVRGGCWNYAPRQCRSAFRTSGNPSLGTDMIGFRIACDNLP